VHCLWDLLGKLRGHIGFASGRSLATPAVQTRGTPLSEFPHARLLRLEILLLGPDYAARPDDAQPRDAFLCREALVLHQVESDQSPGPPQACEAVHSNDTGRIFSTAKEGVDNAIWGRGAVGEDELVVLDACWR